MKNEKSDNNLLKEIMKGINEDAINAGDEREIKKFRINISKILMEMLKQKGEEKKKMIESLKASAFALLAQIPIITPVVTALLQTITSEDLGNKIDILGKDLGSKMDTLGGKMDTLGSKMDKLLELQIRAEKKAEERHKELMSKIRFGK